MIPTDAHVPGLSPKQAHDKVATEVRAGRMLQPGACMVCDALIGRSDAFPGTVAPLGHSTGQSPGRTGMVLSLASHLAE